MIDTEILEKKHPFFFTFDKEMRIQQVGRSLKKLLGEQHIQRLGEEIELESPRFPLQEENFTNNLDKEYFFKLSVRGIELRGALTYDATLHLFIFLGGPWHSYDGILTFDLQGVITSWNPTCYDIFGYTPEETCGQHISLLFPDRLMEDMSLMLEDIREGSALERHETVRLKKGGEEVHVSQVVTPILGAKDQIVGGSCLVQDITARKKIEEDVKKRDKLLRGINQAFHHMLTQSDFFQAVAQAVADVAHGIDADICTVQFEGTKGVMKRRRYLWRGDVGWTKELMRPPMPWKEKLEKHEPVIVTGHFTEEERHFLVLPGTQSLLLLPLIVDGQYAGYLSIENNEERQWLESEISLLGAFSYALAGSYAKEVAEEQLALARAKEIDIGFRIQHALLLGRPPDNLRGITISLVTIASQGIDGDFYDFFPHTRSEFDLLIGDVMGKGIPAALLGAATKSAFNHAITTLTMTLGKPEPREILDSVHGQITTQMIELESFMTIFYARFNNSTKKMTFVDCGHTNTLHFKKNAREVAQLSGVNVPLGFLEKEIYEQVEIPYDYGDVFIFYSDGITEARNKVGEFFGIERLKALMMKSYSEAGDAIVKEVTNTVEQFAESSIFEDDLTLIVVKIEERALQLQYMETLQLPKNLDYLESMRRAIVKFIQRGGLIDPLKVIELELASNEVFTNIVRHSQETATPVDLILEMYLDRVLIHFDYRGARFEPQKIEPPAYDKATAGGFGLYIIQKMVDEVTYLEIEKDHQRITLTKYLA